MGTTPGERLRLARKAAGYPSCADAAAAHHFQKLQLAEDEDGLRSISPRAALAYADAFNVTADWILFGDDGPRRQTDPLGAESEVAVARAIHAARVTVTPGLRPWPDASELERQVSVIFANTALEALRRLRAGQP